MKVLVLNKLQFDSIMRQNNLYDDTIKGTEPFFLISIVDTFIDNPYKDRPEYAAQYQQQVGHFFKKNHENVLNLEFDDVEHDGEPSPTNISDTTKAFTAEQAKILFKFIKKHRDKEQCIVHCMAGISRSGAVGAFINGYARGNWEEFKRSNPQIVPNPRVERMLNEAKYNDY